MDTVSLVVAVVGFGAVACGGIGYVVRTVWLRWSEPGGTQAVLGAEEILARLRKIEDRLAQVEAAIKKLEDRVGRLEPRPRPPTPAPPPRPPDPPPPPPPEVVDEEPPKIAAAAPVAPADLAAACMALWQSPDESTKTVLRSDDFAAVERLIHYNVGENVIVRRMPGGGLPWTACVVSAGKDLDIGWGFPRMSARVYDQPIQHLFRVSPGAGERTERVQRVLRPAKVRIAEGEAVPLEDGEVSEHG